MITLGSNSRPARLADLKAFLTTCGCTCVIIIELWRGSQTHTVEIINRRALAQSGKKKSGKKKDGKGGDGGDGPNPVKILEAGYEQIPPTTTRWYRRLQGEDTDYQTHAPPQRWRGSLHLQDCLKFTLTPSPQPAVFLPCCTGNAPQLSCPHCHGQI